MKEIVHGNVCKPVVKFDIMLKTAVGSPLRSGGITRGERYRLDWKSWSTVSKII
ncbi:hypothetical protein OIU34_33955 [Pararhizobium sp. BT-229]|uniref:hypothetical protein n=1 Tax=Pararhizobium sp. BT-229 TaxID=2986923 RepID=UPI0021F7E5B6|nr:hypothetical protein [Pararhizobium sp. BT-229]MCV9966855.1 hypothetical protein [Pararhizobium sp. BT-229]